MSEEPRYKVKITRPDGSVFYEFFYNREDAFTCINILLYTIRLYRGMTKVNAELIEEEATA